MRISQQSLNAQITAINIYYKCYKKDDSISLMTTLDSNTLFTNKGNKTLKTEEFYGSNKNRNTWYYLSKIIDNISKNIKKKGE